MSRTIKDLSEGQIIHLNETVDNQITYYVPYIYLGLDEIGNAIILRKELADYRRMNNVNIAEYIGCEMDLYLNNMRGELWKTTDKEAKIVEILENLNKNNFLIVENLISELKKIMENG